MRNKLLNRTATCLVASLLLAGAAPAEAPDWAGALRGDHPRLFFNRETWPALRAAAEGEAREAWNWVRRRADLAATRIARQPGETPLVEDLGEAAAHCAFAYRMTGERRYLVAARQCLDSSLAYYELCLRERRAVSWYCVSRVHFVMAWDWLYEGLEAPHRRDLMGRFIDVVDAVVEAMPKIPGENYSGPIGGFYGVRNCLWYIACTAFGTGVRVDRVDHWLARGRGANFELLNDRAKTCGDDGGTASASTNYGFGAYPWAPNNFFYTWRSATGEDLAPRWPNLALFANYVAWNWIESADGRPFEFGVGDTYHRTNRLRINRLYSHLANLRHFYRDIDPRSTELARRVQDRLPDRKHDTTWFIHAFLNSAGEAPVLELPTAPAARHFEAMGQVIMRSGSGSDDTYCVLNAGGITSAHHQYDALSFVIYRGGHQALDTGTRWPQESNGCHLAQYYAQTVAHNSPLIHMENEPAARYWGWLNDAGHGRQRDQRCYGGQRSVAGSSVEAFETSTAFTYVAADGSGCYHPEKCRLATRQMVFVPPDHFVVFDRVESVAPEQKKVWLLHPARRPEIEGATLRSTRGTGRLFCRTLLPAEPEIVVVGGPGSEFRTGDINWALDRSPRGKKAGLTPEQLREIGEWRVEVSGREPRVRQLFLHLIEVGPGARESMVETELLRDGNAVGLAFRAGGRSHRFWFDTEGALGGAVEIEGQPFSRRPLATTVQPQAGI